MSGMICRMGCSTERVTRGKTYSVSCSGRIVDDNGHKMRPSMVHLSGGYPIWVEVENKETNLEDKNMTPIAQSVISIKQAVLIDGQDSDELSAEILIDMISGQEDLITNLRKVKAKSLAITAIISNHEANIIQLVAILDTKDIT